MGILGALSTSVSGLSAQSYALENISGNIANSQTIGFKRVDTSFDDLVPDTPQTRAIAGSVNSYSQLTNTIQGTLQATGVSTNMALSGSGYFAVSQNTGSTQDPSFSTQNLFTRRGDFATNANGYLVNGSGYYLDGTSYNPASGAITGAATSPIRISTASLPAKATTDISYSGNLPSTPQPSNYSATVGGSELLKAADFTTDPTISGAGTVTANDQSTFLKETIDGGQSTVYDSSGTASTVQLRWGKTATSTSGGTDTWQLFYQTNSAATGTGVAWQNAGTAVTFDATGKLTSGSSITLSNLSLEGVNVGNVKLDFSGGLSQYGTSTGTATPTLSQDGYTSGSLSSLSVSTDGVITGSYSNGQTAKLAQVTVAHFAADDALKRMDGGVFQATSESGSPTFGLNGTTLTGGSVEESNTDISDEFSKMIVTQQAYSANTKVMSTAQQMLSDVINIIR